MKKIIPELRPACRLLSRMAPQGLRRRWALGMRAMSDQISGCPARFDIPGSAARYNRAIRSAFRMIEEGCARIEAPEGRYANEENDCVVRALALVTGNSYDWSHGFCAKVGRQPKHGVNSARVVEAYNSEIQPDSFSIVPAAEVRVSVRRFIKEHPHGRYIVRVHRHAFALVDGVALDANLLKSNQIVRSAFKYKYNQ